jgi:signal transduction histidine kinase
MSNGKWPPNIKPLSQVEVWRVRVLGLLAVFAFAAGWSPLSAIADQRPRTVLVIEATTPNTTYFREVNRSFHAAIAAESKNTVYVHVEALAFRDFSGPRYFELLRDLLREKYRDKPIGVIVAYNSLALSFAVQWRDQIWPGTPIIFTGVDDKFAAQLDIPSNVTGFTVRHRLQDMVDVARKLVPALKQVVLVGDRLGTPGYWQFFPEEVQQVAKHLTVTDLTGLPIDDVKRSVTSLPAEAAIIYLGLFTDGAGVSFNPNTALQVISEVANRPIVIDTETFVGAGGVGGPVTSLRRIGEDAARLAWQVIDGADVSSIPIRDADIIRPLFDWRQLQRFDISDSQLPSGSEVLFRPATAWEQYRWQIVLVAIALVGQSLLIAGLLQERYRRQRAELETRQRTAELASMNRRVVAGQMSASITHEVNQPLTAILANAEALQDLLAQSKPDLDKIRSVVTEIISEDTRASEVIDRIRKFLRKDEGKSERIGLNDLVDSTLHLMHADIAKRNVNVETTLAADLPPIAGDPVQLQQVLINLMINAMDAVGSKTLDRRTVRITTQANGTHVELDIVDSGHGIVAEAKKRLFEPFFTTKEHGLGLGLSISATIIKAHGGTLNIDNNIYGGATAHLRFVPAHVILVPS